MKKPLFGSFQAPKTDAHMLGPIQKIDFPMHRFSPDDEVDFCIVGVGSAGGVLVQRLAHAGFRVVGIEAGPYVQPHVHIMAGPRAALAYRAFNLTSNAPLAEGDTVTVQMEIGMNEVSFHIR